MSMFFATASETLREPNNIGSSCICSYLLRARVESFGLFLFCFSSFYLSLPLSMKLKGIDFRKLWSTKLTITQEKGEADTCLINFKTKKILSPAETCPFIEKLRKTPAGIPFPLLSVLLFLPYKTRLDPFTSGLRDVPPILFGALSVVTCEPLN
jgi:hypothetical protein